MGVKNLGKYINRIRHYSKIIPSVLASSFWPFDGLFAFGAADYQAFALKIPSSYAKTVRPKAGGAPVEVDLTVYILPALN